MSAQKTTISLQAGSCHMFIDPARGARITEFSLDGHNVLVTDGPQIGSTFWPSPQSRWDWPPPYEIDEAPYSVEELESGYLLRSPNCPSLGIQVEKVFSIDSMNDGIHIRYRIRNIANDVLQIGAWEVTRMRGGLTLHPRGERLTQSNLPVENAFGCVWYDYDVAALDGFAKHFEQVGEGWIANVACGVMLLKTFDVTADRGPAPGEANIEIYAHNDKNHPYIEIEQQSAYMNLVPQQSFDWDVRWRLFRLPEHLNPKLASPELLATWVLNCLIN